MLSDLGSIPINKTFAIWIFVVKFLSSTNVYMIYITTTWKMYLRPLQSITTWPIFKCVFKNISANSSAPVHC